LAKDESTFGHQQTRAFLRVIYDALGQPPLGGQLHAAITQTLDLLATQDVERRFAVREQIGELLDGGDPHVLVTRPHDWPPDRK
jgi:hypothetical protein